MPDQNRIILEAIARQLCIAAVYNRTRVMLAPQILYTRHGELFIDAVTVRKNGLGVADPKLGTFKCGGLRQLALTGRGFQRFSGFDANSDKYQETTLLAVT